GLESGPDQVAGGDTRSESVRSALAAAPEATVAVIHDAARPLVTVELVERCVAAVNDGWDGAIAAAPMTDTVKRAARDARIEATVPRDALWRAQTPQVFDAAILRRALEAGPDVLSAA